MTSASNGGAMPRPHVSPDHRVTSAPPVVFLGPSLSTTEAEAILPADYRPPVRRGCLKDLGAERVIVLIDGDLGRGVSVRAIEIEAALDRGAMVYGAASMGAVRAAQIDHPRMVGVGWAHNAFRKRVLRSADDVAVAYSPVTMEALTVPVINVLRWLHDLCSAGDLDSRLAERALRMVRRLDVQARRPAAIRACLKTTLGEHEFARLIARNGGALPDVKADDARAVLRHVARRCGLPDLERGAAGKPCGGAAAGWHDRSAWRW